ncbi:MAG: hypothetical protein HKN82_02860 [Akkermansiaceae bacterium]|nr:hypothetical protein [Akkermansiaceae bacterium]NNM30569.1 hypothetical protein [Akkermansiaceae bacterium]
MRTRRKFQKTHLTRPRKPAGAKRRRHLEQRRRLIALGVDEATVDQMNVAEIREMLKYPAKIGK